MFWLCSLLKYEPSQQQTALCLIVLSAIQVHVMIPFLHTIGNPTPLTFTFAPCVFSDVPMTKMMKQTLHCGTMILSRNRLLGYFRELSLTSRMLLPGTRVTMSYRAAEEHPASPLKTPLPVPDNCFGASTRKPPQYKTTFTASVSLCNRRHHKHTCSTISVEG